MHINVPDWCGDDCSEAWTADQSGTASTGWQYGLTACPTASQPRVRVFSDDGGARGPLFVEKVLTANVCSDEWAAGSGESDLRPHARSKHVTAIRH